MQDLNLTEEDQLVKEMDAITKKVEENGCKIAEIQKLLLDIVNMKRPWTVNR